MHLLVCVLMSLLLLMFFEIVFICRRHADPNGFPHLLRTLRRSPRQKLYLGHSNVNGFRVLPVDKFDNHSFILPSAISGEWESVTALDILRIYLHSRSLYKYLSLCSQDRYQEWCLVCPIFPRVVSAAILLPLCLIVFQDKLSCPPVCGKHFLLLLGVSYSPPQFGSWFL